MYLVSVFFKSCIFSAFLTIFEKFVFFLNIWLFLTIFEIWTVKKGGWSVSYNTPNIHFFRKTNFIHFRKLEKDICLEICSLIYIYGKCGNVCMMGKQTYKFLYTILWYVYSRIWYWSVNNVAFLLSWASCVKTKKIWTNCICWCYFLDYQLQWALGELQCSASIPWSIFIIVNLAV